ncbi:MAG: CdvA-like protein [Candidatus Nezhaarchaeales archaeon]
MEPSPIEVMEAYIGKPLKDIYGRHMGWVVGFMADSKNRVKAVEVELGNGEFVTIPCSQVAIGDNAVVNIPSWRVEVEEFHREAEAVQQRLIALDELLEAGEITKDIYDELRKSHESVMSELENKKKDVVEGLKKKALELDYRLKDLERILAATKMLHRANQISEATYKVSVEHLIQGLSRVKAEKKDLEAHLNELLSLKKPEPRPPLVIEEKTPSVLSEEVGREAQHVSPPQVAPVGQASTQQVASQQQVAPVEKREVLHVKIVDEEAERGGGATHVG